MSLQWFVNGNNWTPCIYDRAEELQRIYKAGHVIGSVCISSSLLRYIGD